MKREQGSVEHHQVVSTGRRGSDLSSGKTLTLKTSLQDNGNGNRGL